MGKSTKTLSGQSQRKYFRDLFKSEPGVTSDAAQRLMDACAGEIAHIRVRLPLAKRRASTVVIEQKADSPAATAAALQAKVAEFDPDTPMFDPHAFSLVVLLRKGGKDALKAKLDGLPDIAQLREVAKAQHVAVDPTLEDRSAIYAAIIAGTEQRIAHRQAAGS